MLELLLLPCIGRLTEKYNHRFSVLFFIFSQILTEYIVIEPRVSVRVCVCVSVCLSVCVCHLYSPNRWTDFDETFHKSPTMNLLGPFFSDFENSNLMTSWRPL